MTRGAIASSVAAVLAVLTGCDEERSCNASYVPDTFIVTLDKSEWQPADYRIALAYETDQGEQAAVCSVRLPFVELTETDDGGVEIEPVDVSAADDAGSQRAQERLCPSSLGGSDVRIGIGRALVIRGEGRPDKLQIVIRDPNDVLLERELKPSYVTSEPYGPECGEVYLGKVRLVLP